MSLIYNEFEGSDKNGNDEELKIEKMDLDTKKSKKKKTKRKKAKNNSEEKKEPTSDSKEKVIDKYDTSLEGLEIPLLNNNINNGSLMLTELLDIDNNKNNQEEITNVTNNNINNRTLNIGENNNNNSSFLKKKLENVKLPKNLKKDINSGIEKSHLEIRDDFKNDLLNISNKRTTVNEILGLNKSNGNIFLTSVDKISKENLKRLKSLKLEEKNIKKNIAKINMNTKLIEDGLSLKNNIVDENIRKSQLKNMIDLKENFITKLIRVNQKIELILNEEKLSQKAKNKLDFENLDEAQEEYNLRLKKLREEQNKNKIKFDSDLKIAYEKHQKFCDQLELEKSCKLEKLIKERKENERQEI